MRKMLTAKPADRPSSSTGIDLDDLAAAPPLKKNKPRPMSRRAFDEDRVRTKVLLIEQKWELFESVHLVMLYAILHEKVYGALPLELLKDMRRAKVAAGTLRKREFGDNPKHVIDYLRWTWAREQRDFERRPEDNNFRISWNYQFRGQKLLTDYRIALTRKGRKK